jgi:hypothetical protein
MGGFSSQVQLPQSSAPAGKNAGMSSMQMGQNPIEQSPEEQLLKTQQLQTEQPSFPQGNQMPTDNMGPPLGMMGGQITMPGQGGQPKMGMPNAYSNTMQPWDNQPSKQSQGLGGKGLGSAVGQMAKPTGKGA